MAYGVSNGIVDISWRMRVGDMAVLPTQPVDARFVLIESGVPKPDREGFYLARLVPGEKNKAKILAYISPGGRVFACRACTKEPPVGKPWAYLMYQQRHDDPDFDPRRLYIVRAFDGVHDELAGEVVGDLTNSVCQFTVSRGGKTLLDAMPLDYGQGMAAVFLMLSSFGAHVERQVAPSPAASDAPVLPLPSKGTSPNSANAVATASLGDAAPSALESGAPGSAPEPAISDLVSEPADFVYSPTPTGSAPVCPSGADPAALDSASLAAQRREDAAEEEQWAGVPVVTLTDDSQLSRARREVSSDEYVDWPSVQRMLGDHEFFEALAFVAELEDSYRSGRRKVTAPVQVFLENIEEAGVAALTPERLEDMVPLEGAKVSATLARALRYSGLYFINFFVTRGDEIIDDGGWVRCAQTASVRRALFALESCINRAELVYQRSEERACLAYDFAACAALDRELFSAIGAPEGSERGTVAALAGWESSGREATAKPDRWETSLAFARGAERLRFPYRMSYEFHTSADVDMIGVKVMCPAPGDLPFVGLDANGRRVQALDDSRRNRLVARYVAQVAVTMGAAGFAAGPTIRQVAVNCVEQGAVEHTVLSVVFDREWFAAHATFDGLNMTAADDRGCRHMPVSPLDLVEASGGIVTIQEDGSLGEVPKPAFTFGAGPFATPADDDIETDRRPLTPYGVRLLHVDRISDLGIFEQAERLKAEGLVIDALDREGAKAAVAELEAQRETMEDPKGREICGGLLREFDEGRLDDSSYLEVKEAFEDPYGYKASLVQAEEASRRGDPGVVDVLSKAVERMRRQDMPEDTTDVCYRYFDSYADRCLYQKYCRDDAVGRIVKPLNDTMYFLQDALTQALILSAGGKADGIRNAQICVRMSPGNAGAYLRLARSYFAVGDYEHELEACTHALQYVWQRSELEVILYWEAFALWRLERREESAACYRVCIKLDGGVAEQARTELNELERQYKGLQHKSYQDDVQLLKEKGVFDADRLRANNGYLLDCAHAALEAGSFRLARILTRSAIPLGHDDALLPLAVSLETDPHATDPRTLS